MKKIAVIVGVLLVCAAASDCSAAPVGSLSSGPTNITLCLPAPEGRVVADAQDVVEHTVHVPVTLESVSLVGARGIRVVSPALLPLSAGSPAIGEPWPPSSPKSSSSPVAWSERVGVHQVLGAKVSAATVVFGVSISPGSHSGAASGTRVEYEQGGTREVVTTTTALRLVDQPSC